MNRLCSLLAEACLCTLAIAAVPDADPGSWVLDLAATERFCADSSELPEERKHRAIERFLALEVERRVDQARVILL